jgi:hypothetical protein
MVYAPAPMPRREQLLAMVLIKHPAAHTIASGFAIEATKPGRALAR